MYVWWACAGTCMLEVTGVCGFVRLVIDVFMRMASVSVANNNAAKPATSYNHITESKTTQR